MNVNSISNRCLKLTKLYTLNKNKIYNLYTRNLYLYNKSSLLLVNKKLNDKYLSNKYSDQSASKEDVTQAENSKGFEPLSTKKSRNIVAERSYFDTHAFVTNLMDNGFTKHQAEQLCVLFKEIVNFVSQDIKKDCVTKSGQELAIQQVMIHIGSLKKDMIILEKSEFSTLRNENEKLVLELKNFRETLNLHDASNRLHKLDSRIDTEISNVKALLESFKADTIRYIAGSLFTILVIILGALRYFTL